MTLLYPHYIEQHTVSGQNSWNHRVYDHYSSWWDVGSGHFQNDVFGRPTWDPLFDVGITIINHPGMVNIPKLPNILWLVYHCYTHITFIHGFACIGYEFQQDHLKPTNKMDLSTGRRNLSRPSSSIKTGGQWMLFRSSLRNIPFNLV